MSNDTPAPSMPKSLESILFDLGIGEEENLEPELSQMPPRSPTFEPHSPPPPLCVPPPVSALHERDATHHSSKDLLLKSYAKPSAATTRSLSPAVSPRATRSSSPDSRMTTPDRCPEMEQRHIEAKRVLKRKPIRPPAVQNDRAKRWKRPQQNRDERQEEYEPHRPEYRRQEYETRRQDDRQQEYEPRRQDDRQQEYESTPRRQEATNSRQRQPKYEARRPRSTSRQRQVYYHSKGFVVLAANGTGGYTLTNGVVSVCEDGNDDWIQHMLADLRTCFKATRLFVVDKVTRTQWNKVKQHMKPEDGELKDVLLDSKSNTLGLCTYCKNPLCHRWKAIVGGVQLVLQFPMDCIRH